MSGARTGVALVVGSSLLATTAAVGADGEGPRLKFRDKGPACMCVGGLTEEDIRRSRRQRTETDGRRDRLRLEWLDGEKAGVESKPRGEE